MEENSNSPDYSNPINNKINIRGNYKRGGRNRGRNIYRGGFRYAPQFISPQIYYYNNPIEYQNYPLYDQQIYNPYKHNNSLDKIEDYIYSNYKHLIDINEKNINITSEINTDCKFFIIKSFSEEDVHKSMKYGVWSSSKKGNLTLTNAFNSTKERGSFVYLFFSCNGSGNYIGVAKMKSPCDFKKSFEYWTQDDKWTGLFEVEWLFIKDIPFKEFKNVIITMKDGEIKPIFLARDTQEIPYEQAKIMLNTFEKYQNYYSIFENFEYYDMRQENYEKNKSLKDKEK